MLVQPIGDDVSGVAWTCEEHHLPCSFSLDHRRKGFLQDSRESAVWQAQFGREREPSGKQLARSVRRAGPDKVSRGLVAAQVKESAEVFETSRRWRVTPPPG